MTQELLTRSFGNGLALVVEPMPWLESTAFTLLVPAGCARDPESRFGLANLTCEMVQRGCGERDSRQFVEDLEMLGVESSASVTVAHSSFSSAMPAENLYDALSIHADSVRRPHLAEDQFEDSRLVCLQEVYALEDDLAHKVMLELRRRRYPDPYGRASQGTETSLAGTSLDDVRKLVAETYRPNGAILSVAGKVDWPRLNNHVAELFGDWEPKEANPLVEKPAPGGYQHFQHESSQTHIGIAYPAVPYSHEDYFQVRGAVGVLSDGMSSRLFTEIREKRGLCYSVYASCHSLRDRGSVVCYAGTTTERAQETLDVLVEELGRLAQGIEEDELQRLKARIKSILIMQQESSASRSGAIAADWYFLQRVRSLDEIGRIIDELTCASINRYLAENPPGQYTVVTLGDKELEAPLAVS
ncbi:MAG: M16 family metallopeptidase [Pirellulaceae bacterium]